MKTVFVTGADRGLGLGIAKELLGMGCRVFAGQFLPDWPELSDLQAEHPERLSIVPLDVSSMDSARAAAEVVAREAGALDALINNAAIVARQGSRTIRQQPDYDGMLEAYSVNALGPIRVTEAFLPLLDRGDDRRLCYVSSEAGSIARSHRDCMFGYCMSKSALNMAVSILFNGLSKDGYTFRLYHPGWVRSYMSGTKSLQGDLEPDEAAVPAAAYFMEPGGAREDRLVMRDYLGQEWPW